MGITPSDTASLVVTLSSPSQLIRLHAQRLLVEQGGSSAVSALGELISNDNSPLAAVHAIWVLKEIGAPAGSEVHRILTTALASSQPLIRRHAMLALSAADPAVLAALPSLLEQATNPREKLYVLTSAALLLLLARHAWRLSAFPRPRLPD